MPTRARPLSRIVPAACTAALAAAVLALPAGARAGATAEDALVRFGPFAFQVGGLASPASAAIDEKGFVYVVEEVACRVRVFGPEGVPRRSFGSYGVETGQLCDPRGIALGPDGLVYVADTGNHRVQVFDRDGRFVRVFGGRGSRPGQLRDPLGLAVDERRVVVADSGNDRVQAFDLAGAHLAVVSGHGTEPGRLNHPVDVALDAQGAVYVADHDNHRVQVFDEDGTFKLGWGDRGPYLGLFAGPTGVRVHAGYVYVADEGNHRIQAFDRKGKPVDEWGLHSLAPRQGEGRFHYPCQIAIAPSGERCVVVEGFENRFQVFEPGERPERQSFDQQPSEPTDHFGRMIDARGRMCAIAEPARPSVLVYEVSGPTAIQVAKIARHGTKPGQLISPVDVEVHPTEDVVVVADAATRRLSYFRLDLPPPEALRQGLMARFVRSVDLAVLSRSGAWTAPQPIEPGALEYDADGNLWVLDPRASRVIRIGPELAIERVFGGEDVLRGATDLALSKDGKHVYVVDARARAIKVFDREGNLERSFGRPVEAGRAPEGDRLVRPFGIQAGVDGFVYVTDEGADAVVKFDERGSFVARFGENGLGKTQFQKPAGLAQDGKRRLYVLDYGNHRAQVFHPTGDYDHAFGPKFFLPPR